MRSVKGLLVRFVPFQTLPFKYQPRRLPGPRGPTPQPRKHSSLWMLTGPSGAAWAGSQLYVSKTKFLRGTCLVHGSPPTQSCTRTFAKRLWEDRPRQGCRSRGGNRNASPPGIWTRCPEGR